MPRMAPIAPEWCYYMSCATAIGADLPAGRTLTSPGRGVKVPGEEGTDGYLDGEGPVHGGVQL